MIGRGEETYQQTLNVQAAMLACWTKPISQKMKVNGGVAESISPETLVVKVGCSKLPEAERKSNNPTAGEGQKPKSCIPTSSQFSSLKD